jgi:thiol:disulfide interchange protein DsbD
MTPANRIARPSAVVIAIVALLATLSSTTQGEPEAFDSPLVDVSLIADVQSVEPGIPFHAGIRMAIAPGWHINWINPGDAGLAPSIDWKLPDGFSAEPAEWPHPRRYPAGPLAIFGYQDTVTLWSAITPPAQLDTGARITLAADVDWLACEEACVPGSAPASLTLPVEATARMNVDAARAYERTRRRVPVVAPEWSLAATYDRDAIAIEIDPVRPGDGPPPDNLFFYPDTPGIIENAEPQRLEPGGSGSRLVIPRSRMVGDIPERLTGVLVAPTGWGPSGRPALQVDIPLQPR